MATYFGWQKSLINLLTLGLANLSKRYVDWRPQGIKINDKENDNTVGDVASGLLGRYTGANLTPAEIQANAFSAAEAEKARQFSSSEAAIARNFELEMSNTAKQRQVVDLQKAGLNPMLAADSGVVLPSASNASASVASSVSPGAAAFNLSGIIQALSNIGLVRSQSANLDSLTEKNKQETEHQKIVNQYASEFYRLRNEGQQEANGLRRAEIEAVYEEIKKTKASVQKTIAETKSEEERKELIIAQRMLENANAWRIKELLPFEKQLSAAQSSAARAQAEYSLAQAAYQNGLIDAGMIELAAQEAGFKRDSAEYQSAIDRVKSQMSGDIPFDDESVSPTLENLIKGLGRIKYLIK